VHVRTILTVLTLASIALAGCSGGGGGDKAGDDPTEDLGLEATDTTGVIRGVVVNEAIVPIPGVVVTLLSTGQTAESNDLGAFGFEGLEPGSYFLTASKPGFKPVQQSADVEAGVEDPKVVRVMMLADPTTLPTYEVFHFQGYLQCSLIAGTPVTGGVFMPCDIPFYGPVGSDKSYTTFAMNGNATWIHVSLVWTPTQAVGQNLYFNVLDNYGDYNVPAYNGGPSPLTGDANAEAIAESKINEQGEFGFEVAVFGEAGFVGASVNQGFDAYIVVFHGFEPPEGYAYHLDGEPTIPGAP
jgi:hypothetical protein